MKKMSVEFLLYRRLKEIYGTSKINNKISLDEFKKMCLYTSYKIAYKDVCEYFDGY